MKNNSNNIIEFDGHVPKIHTEAFIADNARIIGNVDIRKNASIWFGAVLRGDVNRIVIGEDSNIQDGVVIHVSYEHDTSIGARVTIGHSAVIHACTICDECLIGMSAVILDGAYICSNAIVAAGAVITHGSVVQEDELWAGIPAKCIKSNIEQGEYINIKKSAQDYVDLSKKYLR